MKLPQTLKQPDEGFWIGLGCVGVLIGIVAALTLLWILPATVLNEMYIQHLETSNARIRVELHECYKVDSD